MSHDQLAESLGKSVVSIKMHTVCQVRNQISLPIYVVYSVFNGHPMGSQGPKAHEADGKDGWDCAGVQADLRLYGLQVILNFAVSPAVTDR